MSDFVSCCICLNLCNCHRSACYSICFKWYIRINWINFLHFSTNTIIFLNPIQRFLHICEGSCITLCANICTANNAGVASIFKSFYSLCITNCFKKSNRSFCNLFFRFIFILKCFIISFLCICYFLLSVIKLRF